MSTNAVELLDVPAWLKQVQATATAAQVAPVAAAAPVEAGPAAEPVCRVRVRRLPVWARWAVGVAVAVAALYGLGRVLAVTGVMPVWVIVLAAAAVLVELALAGMRRMARCPGGHCGGCGGSR